MINRSKRKVKHKIGTDWSVLIAGAERQLEEARFRVSKLEETVQNFKRLRDEGMPLPGHEKAGTDAKSIPA